MLCSMVAPTCVALYSAVRRLELDFSAGNHSTDMSFTEQRCNKRRHSVAKEAPNIMKQLL